TDTRATGLLAGAGLALWLAIRRRVSDRAATGGTRAQAGPSVRFSRGSALVLLALLLLMYLANGSSAWLYPYGFLLVDAGTVLLILAVVQRPGAFGARALSLPGLQALGQISYGLYLWHFPLFLWLDSTTTGLSGLHLLMFRLGVTLLVSAASYVLIEQPIRQRRLPTIQVRRLAPIGALAALISVLVASSVAVLPTVVPAAAHLPKPTNKLVGTDPACSVQLIDQPGYGVAPVPLSQEAQFEYRSLGKHQLTWEGKASQVFHTCPPKRVLLIGDSLAFTLGVPLMGDEQHYGMEVANAATLGCAFATRGELNVNGTWKLPDAGCQTALSTWEQDEAVFHPSEVVVEMGYRDEFDWSWGGNLQHLGNRAFDAYELQQIERYVTVLSRGGAKILFLTVPYTNPPAQANGAAAPAASPTRHYDMSWLLHRVAARHPGVVSVLNIDQTISPGNRYSAALNGQDCRFDGIHFTVYCAKVLEPRIMGAARKMVG
ncbi:MAG TPA: SGNH hydrolase domain-containing protein, partial [Solirubrobacteraceae bacterium]|nr:SGNH hydrolase domain-containing protein [Solirubrobacteraceae bacterium]